MNDKSGKVKRFIGMQPNNPKENNSLTATTKMAVFNHRDALHKNMYLGGEVKRWLWRER